MLQHGGADADDARPQEQAEQPEAGPAAEHADQDQEQRQVRAGSTI